MGVDRRSWIVAIGLLALALWLRLGDVGLAQFKSDEATLLDRALSFLEGGSLPLHGNPSAIGIWNPPTFVYLITIPLLFWRSPIAVSAFLALLGSLAVPATYLLARRYFGPLAAFATGLAYAVNPWSIFLTRQIWEPDSLQLFVVLFAIACLAFAVDRRKWAGAALLPAFAVLTELHFSTVALAPVAIAALVFGRRSLRWRILVIGALMAMLTYSPYIYRELSTGFDSIHRILSMDTSKGKIDLQAIDLAQELFGRFEYFQPDDLLVGPLALLRESLLRYGGLVAIAIGLAVSLAKALFGTHDRRAAYWLVLIWAASPIALSIRHPMDLYVHYFVPLIPVGCILVGIGVASVAGLMRATLTRARRPTSPGIMGSTAIGAPWTRLVPAAVVVVLALAIAIPQAMAFLSFDSQIRAGNRDRFVYGVPVTYTTRLVEYLVTQGVTSVHVSSPGSDLGRTIEVLSRFRIQAVYDEGKRSLPLPTSESVYVAQYDRQASAAFLDQAAAQYRTLEIRSEDQPVYGVYRLPADFAELVVKRFAPLDYHFDNGLWLRGISAPRALVGGKTAVVGTLWYSPKGTPGSSAQPRDADTRPDDVFVAFGQAVDPAGHQIAKAQQYGHDPSTSDRGGYWISWLEFDVGDVSLGTAWLDLGIFRSPGIQPVSVYDATGKRVGDQVRYGPVKTRSASTETPPPPQQSTSARISSFAELEGYDVDDEDDTTLQVRLHWRAVGETPANYQVFVHVVGPNGDLIGQHDGPPGSVPTSLWETGDRLVDAHSIKLAQPIQEGTEIRVGMYSLSDGKRLPATGDSANGDYVSIRIGA